VNVFKNATLALRGAWRDYFALHGHMEVIYRALFLREIAKMGIADIFYPVGAAANHSFLYLIARSLRELPFSNVLEFGAGQTTLLLNEFRKKTSRQITVTTIESAASWAENIKALVDHAVVLSPLAKIKTSEGKSVQWYSDLSSIRSDQRFDFILIDGPYAASFKNRWNRLGAETIIPHILSDNFVLIIDDSDRPGERLLAKAIELRLRNAGIEYFSSVTKSGKWQTVIASKRYMQACYF
jgi:predicted O-methyltransferase YrrM